MLFSSVKDNILLFCTVLAGVAGGSGCARETFCGKAQGGAGSPSHDALRMNYIINRSLSRDLLVVSGVQWRWHWRVDYFLIVCRWNNVLLVLCCAVKYRRSFSKIRKLNSKALPIVVMGKAANSLADEAWNFRELLDFSPFFSRPTRLFALTFGTEVHAGTHSRRLRRLAQLDHKILL